MNRLPATLLISFLAISYWAPRARAQDNAAEAVAVKTEIAFVLVVYGLTPGSQVIRIVYPDERVEIINLNSEKGVDPYVHRDKVVITRR